MPNMNSRNLLESSGQVSTPSGQAFGTAAVHGRWLSSHWSSSGSNAQGFHGAASAMADSCCNDTFWLGVQAAFWFADWVWQFWRASQCCVCQIDWNESIDLNLAGVLYMHCVNKLLYYDDMASVYLSFHSIAWANKNQSYQQHWLQQCAMIKCRDWNWI